MMAWTKVEIVLRTKGGLAVAELGGIGQGHSVGRAGSGSASIRAEGVGGARRTRRCGD